MRALCREQRFWRGRLRRGVGNAFLMSFQQSAISGQQKQHQNQKQFYFLRDGQMSLARDSVNLKNGPIVIDLFCGCGGFSLGAARVGFSVVGAADNDLHALAAHKRNFPRSKHLNVDLSQVSGAMIRELLTLDSVKIDGIIGGPPCQGFSSIGNRDINDPRNHLFGQFFRLVSQLRPRFFLAENVPGILYSNYDSIRTTTFKLVEDDYTILPPMKLFANDYGTPTSRLRVFFFGYQKQDQNTFVIEPTNFQPPPDVEEVRVKTALKGLPQKIRAEWKTEQQGWRKVGDPPNGVFGDRLFGCIPEGVGDQEAIRRLKEENFVSGCLGTKHSSVVIERFSRIGQGEMDDTSKSRRLDLKGFCPTLRAGTGKDRGRYQAVRPIHPTQDRVITPREAARLQGFPDWFQFDATKWHSFRQIGNSVSPILAEYILGAIRSTLEGKTKKPKEQ